MEWSDNNKKAPIALNEDTNFHKPVKKASI